MTTDLAVASITLALKQELQSALIRAGGLGAEVKTEKPDRMTDTATPTVNLYLYAVAINPFMRNDDVVPEVVRKPGVIAAQEIQTFRVPLRLRYLLSFYGDEKSLIPQRLLAACVAELHRAPLITSRAVLSSAGAQFPDVSPADFPDFEDVRLTMTNVSLEDCFRLWSVFRAPYALSVGYEASTAVVASAPITTDVDLVEEIDLRITALPPGGTL